MEPISQTPTEQLVEAGRTFYQRGWARSGGGSYSVLLARKPMRLCITAAGNEKGSLDETNFLELDDDAEILQGFGRPSTETLLHLTIYRLIARARCILYSQTVAGIVLSDRHFVDGGISLTGYEALRGMTGVHAHDHVEQVPIIENSTDNLALSHVIQNVLIDAPDLHAILIRRHGLYAWGETVADARRHLEILEFLFEVLLASER